MLEYKIDLYPSVIILKENELFVKEICKTNHPIVECFLDLAEVEKRDERNNKHESYKKTV